MIEDLLRESGDIAHNSRLKLLGKQISRTDLLLGEIGPGPDEEFRRQMGRRARESAISRYRTDIVIPKYIDFYEKILASSSAGEQK